jgi:hypothetical protein
MPLSILASAQNLSLLANFLHRRRLFYLFCSTHIKVAICDTGLVYQNIIVSFWAAKNHNVRALKEDEENSIRCTFFLHDFPWLRKCRDKTSGEHCFFVLCVLHCALSSPQNLSSPWFIHRPDSACAE